MPRPTDGTANISEPLRAKALLVHQLLCDAYRCPIDYFHSLDPLSELVSSMLSHRTRNAESGKAFKALRRRYADWVAVRDAPTSEVQQVIEAVTWPELKAPRIQQVLREITTLRDGDLSLQFLGDLDVVAGREWLERLTGVGPKTSAAVLSFSTLRKAALPVDSHHHRVAVRVGLIPASLAVGPAHEVLAAQLPPDWSAQQVYDNHEVLMIHGQRCCFFKGPACPRCPILDLCPAGMTRIGNVAQGLTDRTVTEAEELGDPAPRGTQSKAWGRGDADHAPPLNPDEETGRGRSRRRKAASDPSPGLFD